MPPGEEPESPSRKRRRTSEIAPLTDAPQPRAKRQKRSQRSRTPPEFWDNLSRIPLCRRALREFNRRASRSVASQPLARSVPKGDQINQLKRFTRHGGPNLRDIRGYPAPKIEVVPAMSLNQSRSSRSQMGTDPSDAQSQSTRKTSLTSRDPAFEQALIDGGYHLYNRGPKPTNFEEIKERLAQPRPSLSPSQFSDGAFERFQLKNEEAADEDTVSSRVFPIIEDDFDMPSGQNQLFNNVQPLASGIANAKPDHYFGSRPIELDPRVRKDLAPYVIPCTATSRPLLPNHFTEVKGPDGKASEMKRQITHDLGIGARGMLKAQSYGQDGYTYDGNAYTLGSTYHSGTGTLQMYAMHPTQPASPSGPPQYHTTQLHTFGMTGSADTFRQGATWYRNSRDLAKEWRDSAIARANAIANAEDRGASETSVSVAYESQSQETVTSLHDTNETVHDDTDTSLDAPTLVSTQSRKRTKLRQPRSRKRASTSSSASRSAPTETWRFADGQFHCYEGGEKARSQGDQPRDVWVFRANGWPNSTQNFWCFWKSDGTAEYR